MSASARSWTAPAGTPQETCRFETLHILYPPPYSPELNPVEHLWDHLREKDSWDRVFATIEALEIHLMHSPARMETEPQRCFLTEGSLLSKLQGAFKFRISSGLFVFSRQFPLLASVLEGVWAAEKKGLQQVVRQKPSREMQPQSFLLDLADIRQQGGLSKRRHSPWR
jgi:hypothetical protein